MAYYPQTFHYIIDETTGYRKYDDHQLQITYLNLRIVSNLIADLQTNAKIDLLDAQNNVSVKAVQDQTCQILGIFACKILEGISVFFTAGTAPAIATMIIGRLLSATITELIKDSSPNDDIQKKANEVREGMDAIFSSLKHRVDQMIVDMEGQWNVAHYCESYLDPSQKGNVYLRDFEYNQLFPDRNSPEYDDMLEFLSARCRSIIVSELLPVKWRIKNWPTYNFKDYYQYDGIGDKHYDFDYCQYNPHTDDDFWAQEFNSIPEDGFGTKFICKTQDGHQSMVDWLSSMCLNPSDTYRYTRYSSYYIWTESLSFNNGNKHFIGATIYQQVLVDTEGNMAPTVLTEWLFKDKKDSNKGIATKEDVYKNWGLQVKRLSLLNKIKIEINRIFFKKCIIK